MVAFEASERFLMKPGSLRGSLASLLMAMGCVTLAPCLPAQTTPLLQSEAEKAASILRVWNTAMGMAFLDHGQYPQTKDIFALAAFLEREDYWETPVVNDPWGRPYRCDSRRAGFHVWSAGPDGLDATDDDQSCGGDAPQDRVAGSHSKEQRPNLVSKRSPGTGRVGNTLTVTRSGDDVVLAWAPTGVTYDVVGSTTARFLNPFLLSRQASTTHTYVGAFSGGGDLEFFDVTDETETNRGEDGSGSLPPPPPAVDPLPGGTALVIGSTASLSGTGFSELPADNLICFAGGICLSPDTATQRTTQLSFTVPPGAVSSSLTVSNGILQSAAITADIYLESPGVDILRSLGFAARPDGGVDVGGEYWTTSRVSGQDHVYRHYFDPASGSWTREAREGPYTGIHYTSTKTDRFQNLYVGYGTIGASGGSRRIATDPPANMANCVNLGGSGSIQVLGAAPDPNPDGVGGRDVVYFAFKDAGAGTEYIKKVNVTAGGCSGVADNDYGNRGGSWNWDFQVGMSVDEDTGDLYVPEKTKITVVATNETVSTFKTGFSRLFGVDVWHEPGGSFGAVLAADISSGVVTSVSLDNPGGAPLNVASGSLLRTVTWSRSSHSTQLWASAIMNRVTFAHNTGGNIALWPAPTLNAEPYAETAHVWISSPDPDDKADYQGVVRDSDPAATDYSTFKVKAWWDDGVARDICAMLGDAPTTAGYEPKPTADACWLPWEDPQTGTPNGICDNQEPFDGSAGVGTSTDTDTFKECESSCGMSWGDACEFEFRITQRYAGDNYRVYFFQPSGKSIIMSALVTAWKRAYIENDAMCSNGALLKLDANNGQDFIILAFHPDGSVPPDPSEGQTIHIFDASHPMTSIHDLACVRQRMVDTPDQRVRIDLGEVGNCTQAYTLQVSDLYDADDNGGPDDPWGFDSGRSAGICVDGSAYYVADTSQLNTRDRTGPFDDAFVHFAVPSAGAGILPYFPELDMSDGVPMVAALRFHQIWFDHKRPFLCEVNGIECDNCCNEEQNYFHLMGLASRETGDWGKTRFQSDASFSFGQAIEDFCTGCSPTELANALQRNANHEIAHQFEVNCPNPTPPPTPYHNLNDAWCGVCDGGYLPWCLMHVDSEPLANRTDGIDRFCCYNLLADPTLCSSDVTQCGEGLRVTTDPK